MPRGLTAAQKAYAGPVTWLADITARSGTKYYFGEDVRTVLGNTYQPYLRLASGPRFNRTLAADFGEIELLNVDLTIGDLLKTQEFEGALCELRQLQLGLDSAILILRGRLTEQDEAEDAVRFRLVSELDPAQIPMPRRVYADLCTWRFGSSGKTPLNAGPCGYREDAISWTVNLGGTVADIFSAFTIGNSGLSMTVNVHVDRVALITNGPGTAEYRRIKSNTATTLTLYQPWKTTPTASSKFAILTPTNGLPRSLIIAVESGNSIVKLETTATSGAARSLTDTGLAMTTDEHKGEWVRIIAGAGSGQRRKIGSNTATQFTIDAAEPDFSPAPDSSSVFRVLYKSCPKDITHSCEQRGRTMDFNGFPTLVPMVSQALSGGDPGDIFPPIDGGGGDGGSPGIGH